MRKVCILLICLLLLSACQSNNVFLEPQDSDSSENGMSQLPQQNESSTDTEAIRTACIHVGELFLADLFNFPESVGFEDEAYWQATLRYTIYESLDDLITSPYYSCGFDATGETSGKAKSYVLRYIAERAEITPGEIDLIDGEKMVELTYDLTIIPGRDAFKALEEADILNWFAQWYDNALPSVNEILEQMEPVQTTFVIAFKKTENGYLVEDYPNTIGNRILSISKDNVEN